MARPTGIVKTLLSFILLLGIANVSHQASDIERLHVALFTNYNKQIRPVQDYSQSLPVNVSLKLISFDYDDMNARISARGYYQMMWKDSRLVWPPSDYGNVQSIHIQSSFLWTPDLEVYNLEGQLSEDRVFATATQVLVTSDGTVVYVPLANMVAQCSPNMEGWPYDKHECSIKVGSWTHHIEELTLFRSNNETTIDVDAADQPSARWELLSTKVVDSVKQYPCCKELYQSVSYTLSFQRRSAAAVFTIITPTYVIVALTLATFFIPPMVGAKLIVGVVNLTLICIFLIHFNSTLPSSVATPKIVEFYGATLILTAISVLSSIAVFSWTRLPKSRSPPAFILKAFTCCSFHRLLGVKIPSNTQMAEEQKLSLDNTQNNAQQLWIYLSLALHRILFGIYCVVFVALIKCLSFY